MGTELTYEGSKPIERLDFALFTNVAERGGKNANRSPIPKTWPACPKVLPRSPGYHRQRLL